MLRILCLEDVEDDAILIKKQLLTEGITSQFDHVTNETDYISKLKTGSYDIILSDYNLPGFHGIAALMTSKKLCPSVPFICVSGTIGEDIAVELMQLGASDYILKDRLSKLPVAIKRAIQESEHQKASFEAEKEIKYTKDALEELNQRLNDIREDERASIARAIHDQLGQSLTALKIHVDWLSKQTTFASDNEAKLQIMSVIITDMIKDVQRIASELRPSILDDIGLVPAMEWYITEFEKRTGINCHLNLEDVQFGDEKKNLVFYRILQEALTNVSRHSNANNVNVNFYRSRDGIILEVNDDGIGLEREKIISFKSLGFVGIRERLKQHNGTLEIKSVINKNTMLRITIPFS